VWSKVLLISIIYETNAMESNTGWIRLFHIVFVIVSLTTSKGEVLVYHTVFVAITKSERDIQIENYLHSDCTVH